MQYREWLPIIILGLLAGMAQVGVIYLSVLGHPVPSELDTISIAGVTAIAALVTPRGKGVE